jgi:hypothetical protein
MIPPMGIWVLSGNDEETHIAAFAALSRLALSSIAYQFISRES